jgi:hypothetical protein
MERPAKRVKRERQTAPEPKPRCFLLEIPIEVRLLIFDYALAETNHITISVAELEKNIFDDSEPEETIEGIPGKYVPLVKNAFDPEMMEIGKVGVIPLPDMLSVPTLTGSMDSGYGSFGPSTSMGAAKFGRPNLPEVPLLTSMSLFLTNRQIHDEMTAHIKHPTSERSTLHVNYPYGIIVLETLYPSLLRYAEKICISGWFDSTDSLPGTQIRNMQPGISLSDTTDDVYDIANSALTRLVRTTMSPTQHPTLKYLSFRIFYPLEAPYSVIWSCNDSPVAVALRNICGGKIDMKVLRGNCGNGIVLNVVPGARDRHLTTAWRKFQGNRRKEVEAWRCFGDEKVWEKDIPDGQTWIVA